MSPIPERLIAALTDRFRIERELGAGGMATGYLAHDLKHDRLVAVKVLKPELAAVLGAERFVVEIKTTVSMSHPHSLPWHDLAQRRERRPVIDGAHVRLSGSPRRVARKSALAVETPRNRLPALDGDRSGQHAHAVDAQRRIRFRLEEGACGRLHRFGDSTNPGAMP